MSEPVLQIHHLSKTFGPGQVIAVDNVSFFVQPGETLGIVGESGCGKTTLARMIAALETPSQGEIYLLQRKQKDWLAKKTSTREYRKKIQYVFQDPIMSLNPRKTVQQILELPLRHMTDQTRPQRETRVRELMDLVGLRAEFLDRYPHQFSGGQCQRIGIARAIATEPDILVLDEPVSALDVSIQAQILNLLGALQTQLGLTYLFISHDLAVIENLSDRVLVMFGGRVVEEGSCTDIFASPQQDYTKKLLISVPRLSA